MSALPGKAVTTPTAAVAAARNQAACGCAPAIATPRKRAPAIEIASAQSCGVRLAAAFQMPPRVTEVPVVAAAAVEACVLASTGRAERAQDVVGVRVEAKRGLELPDGRRLSPRPQVGLSELEPEVDLPRLLPHGGAERRDVCRPAGERRPCPVRGGREG